MLTFLSRQAAESRRAALVSALIVAVGAVSLRVGGSNDQRGRKRSRWCGLVRQWPRSGVPGRGRSAAGSVRAQAGTLGAAKDALAGPDSSHLVPTTGPIPCHWRPSPGVRLRIRVSLGRVRLNRSVACRSGSTNLDRRRSRNCNSDGHGRAGVRRAVSNGINLGLRGGRDFVSADADGGPNAQTMERFRPRRGWSVVRDPRHAVRSDPRVLTLASTTPRITTTTERSTTCSEAP